MSRPPRPPKATCFLVVRYLWDSDAEPLNNGVTMCTCSDVIHVAIVFPRVCPGANRCPYRDIAVDCLFPSKKGTPEPHDRGHVHMVSYSSFVKHRGSDKLGGGPCVYLNQSYTNGPRGGRIVINFPMSPMEGALAELYMVKQLGAGFNKVGMYTNALGPFHGLVTFRENPPISWSALTDVLHDKVKRTPDEVLSHPYVVRHFIRHNPDAVAFWLSLSFVPKMGPHFCSQLVLAAMQYGGTVPANSKPASATPAGLVEIARTRRSTVLGPDIVSPPEPHKE